MCTFAFIVHICVQCTNIVCTVHDNTVYTFICTITPLYATKMYTPAVCTAGVEGKYWDEISHTSGITRSVVVIDCAARHACIIDASTCVMLLPAYATSVIVAIMKRDISVLGDARNGKAINTYAGLASRTTSNQRTGLLGRCTGGEGEEAALRGITTVVSHTHTRTHMQACTAYRHTGAHECMHACTCMHTHMTHSRAYAYN